MNLADAYMDSRYIDIGDLPTGFGPYKNLLNMDKIYVRPFCVRELLLLHMGASLGSTGLSHIFRAVDLTISCDVYDLTDGDFEYVMAWLRHNSYPKAPSLVKWTCRKINIVEKEGRAFRHEPELQSLTDAQLAEKGLMREECDTQSNEIVHNVTTQINSLDDDDDLSIPYSDIDFPRIRTRLELADILEERPEYEHHARMARWVHAGSTLAEKMDILENSDLDLYSRIQECISRYRHGIQEKMRLRCRTCGNEIDHIANPNPLTFFADNSEKDVLDIQYTLLAELKLQPSDDMPAKTLLYHHSCLMKDKQEEEERRRLEKSIGGKHG